MSMYMFQAAYTNESWKHQIQSPENPQERLTPFFDAVGGRITSIFYCFGDYDVVVIAEMPNDEAAAAFALVASAGGSVKSLKTTPLLAVDQGMSAMQKASQASSRYRAPVAGGTVRETVPS